MPFTAFHPHQLDNYARLAIAGSAIYAADPGTGKTLAAFAVPFLLADIRQRSGRAIDLANPTAFIVPKVRFYLCSYNALGQNGGDEWPDDRDGHAPAVATMQRKGIDPGYCNGIGQEKRGIRCIGSPTLATALTCLGGVIDCVIADEAVKAKNQDSFAGEALARMHTAHRFAFSGTPIKSNLPDIHPLAEWVAGAPAASSQLAVGSIQSAADCFTVLIIAPEQLHEQFMETARDIFRTTCTILHTAADAFADAHLSARMTRRDTAQARRLSLPGRDRFCEQFLATEHNITRERREFLKGRRRKFSAPSHIITRRHLLHRTLAPFILRQRKADLGIPLIKNMKQTIQLPFAAAQWNHYKETLDADTGDSFAGTVTALRQSAIMAPKMPATPKLEWTLRKIIEKMWDGKQGLVLSPFTAFSKALRDVLHAHDIPCLLLDGSVSPAKRGMLAKQFKNGSIPVLIGGQRSMGTGSSFPNAQYLIKPGGEWSHDDNDQTDQRHDRLDSPDDVDTYTLITSGSIDERIHDRASSRAANSSAALGDDGMTGAEFPSAAVLTAADLAVTAPSGPIEHEEHIAARIATNHGPRLRAAFARYREHHPAIVPDTTGSRIPVAAIRHAVATTADPDQPIEKNNPQARIETALAKLKKQAGINKK